MLPRPAAIFLLPLAPQTLRPLTAAVVNDVRGQWGRVGVLVELRAGVGLLLGLDRESWRAGQGDPGGDLSGGPCGPCDDLGRGHVRRHPRHERRHLGGHPLALLIDPRADECCMKAHRPLV